MRLLIVFVYSPCFEYFAIKLCLCFITTDLARVVCNMQYTYHIPLANSELF